MADVAQARFPRSVLEGAVALVAEEEVAAAGAGDVQVLPAVVPRVGKDGGGADAVPHGDTGLVSHVGEGAVAVVAVQGIGPELVGEIDVVVTVAVEVGDGQAAAVVVQVAPELLPLLPRKEPHLEGDPRFLRPFVEAGRLASPGRIRPLVVGPLSVAQNQEDDQAEGEQGSEGAQHRSNPHGGSSGRGHATSSTERSAWPEQEWEEINVWRKT